MTISSELQAILDLLRNEETRWDGILKLKTINDPKIVEPLISLLRDPEWVIRWSIAEKLGDLGDTRAIKPLLGLLLDTDLHVRKNAVKALVKFKLDVVIPTIALFSHSHPLVRRYAHFILSKIGVDIFPLLKEILPKLNWIESNRVLLLMWSINGEAAIDYLISFLDEPEIRKNAMMILGNLKAQRAIVPLMRYYNVKGLKAIVTRVIEEMGPEIYAEPLLNMVEGDDPVISTSAGSLSLRFGPEILPFIIKRLSEYESSDARKLLYLIDNIGVMYVERELKDLFTRGLPFHQQLERYLTKRKLL